MQRTWAPAFTTGVALRYNGCMQKILLYYKFTPILDPEAVKLWQNTLCESLNLRGKQSKNSKYHSYKGEVGKISENILNRDFNAQKPFDKLTTDITEFKVCDDKVYLSTVLDLFNREVISYSISLSGFNASSVKSDK